MGFLVVMVRVLALALVVTDFTLRGAVRRAEGTAGAEEERLEEKVAEAEGRVQAQIEDAEARLREAKAAAARLAMEPRRDDEVMLARVESETERRVRRVRSEIGRELAALRATKRRTPRPTFGRPPSRTDRPGNSTSTRSGLPGWCASCARRRRC